MTTRPTTDGDTKAALERVRECVETYEHMDLGYKDDPEVFEALDLITTRLSELERLRMPDVGDGPCGRYVVAMGKNGPDYRALTPTTQDQSESSGEG